MNIRECGFTPINYGFHVIKKNFVWSSLKKMCIRDRSNFNHQTTNKIVKTKPSRVVMETLNIKGMMENKHLSKAIGKQCLYQFKKQMVRLQSLR